jgi:hypothetical protein
MNNKKPSPLVDAPLRAVCPVCGKTSYSPGGRHPQCGVTRADAELKALQRAAAVELVAAGGPAEPKVNRPVKLGGSWSQKPAK